MKCERCGAEYRMKDVRCPFCQSENPVLAEIRKEQTLKQYDREAQRMMDTVPDMAVKKWTGRLMIICGILAGAAVLAGLVMLLWGPIKAKIDYQVHQRREQELEEMLSRRDIEGICAYMDSGNIKSYQFRKFEEIRDVHVYYNLFRDYAEYLELYINEDFRSVHGEQEMRETVESVALSLVSYGSQVMQYCRHYSRDRIIRGNEDFFEEYDRDVRSRLEQLGMSPQLLEWMSLEQEDKQEDDWYRQAVDTVVNAYVEQ